MTEVKEKITVTELPITALRSFEEHPYKVVDNEEMASLVESIYTQGILTPLTVRPLDNGEYEIFLFTISYRQDSSLRDLL